jgi:hypothetical protein
MDWSLMLLLMLKYFKGIHADDRIIRTQAGDTVEEFIPQYLQN